MDFRSHVALCTEFSVKLTAAVTSLSRSSKTKVSDFQLKGFADEHVLRFQVSVGDTL